jgi:hypothetical protein
MGQAHFGEPFSGPGRLILQYPTGQQPVGDLRRIRSMSVLWPVITTCKRCECGFADQSADPFAHPLRW